MFSITGAGVFNSVASLTIPVGMEPVAGLSIGPDGLLYGTGSQGGKGFGTVYRLNADATVTAVHAFDASQGSNPVAALTLGEDGSFYGTTLNSADGSLGGTVYRLGVDGSFSQLYNFVTDGCDSNPSAPYGTLLPGAGGLFYGTVSRNGIFSITTSGDYQNLHIFNGSDGYVPYSGLVAGADGALYGTTSSGGEAGYGEVYRLDSQGQLTVLHSFSPPDGSGVNADGASPFAALTMALDGNLYGSTASGGHAGYGTLFRISITGEFATLHSFDCVTEGTAPTGALVQRGDGNFYSTASGCFSNHLGGTVFQLTPDGTLTILHTFIGPDGLQPYGSLAFAPDGDLYGTTQAGGSSGVGTVFRIGLAPFAPTAVTATATSPSTITLSWPAVTGANRYNVYQGLSAGGEDATPVQTGITGTQTEVIKLDSSTTYYFRVSAVNAQGESPRSSEVSAQTQFASGGAIGVDLLVALGLLGAWRRRQRPS